MVVTPACRLITELIDQAQQRPLWIRYTGGQQPGTVRQVTPVRWCAYPYSFFAHCDRDNVEKKYLTQRVADARREAFE